MLQIFERKLLLVGGINRPQLKKEDLDNTSTKIPKIQQLDADNQLAKIIFCNMRIT
jgi:hypothetical protein